MYCIQWKISDCILTYAVVKLFGICLFGEQQREDYAIPQIAVFVGGELLYLCVSYSESYLSFAIKTLQN